MLCNAFKPLKRNLCICHEDVVSSWGKWNMKWVKRSREGWGVMSCLSALISALMSWRWDREEGGGGEKEKKEKLNLCGILWKRPCPRSWNLLSQACVMWLQPALPSSAPSLPLSGDFHVRKGQTPDPFRLGFFFFFCSCSPSAILVDSDHVDPQSARTMTQDFRMLDFDFVRVFFSTQMPTRWMRPTEWKSPLVVIREQKVKPLSLPILSVSLSGLRRM